MHTTNQTPLTESQEKIVNTIVAVFSALLIALSVGMISLSLLTSNSPASNAVTPSPQESPSVAVTHLKSPQTSNSNSGGSFGSLDQ